MASPAARPLTAAVATLLLTLLAGLAGPLPAAHAQRLTPRFWGLMDPLVEAGDAVPHGAIHLGTEASWLRVERAPGDFRWEHADEVVAQALAERRQPLLILGNTPAFHVAHADPAYDPRTRMPRLDPWRRWVRTVTERYGGRVDYQVWNEPNVTTFWSGTPDQMARLTKIAGRIVQRRAPGAAFLSGSMPVRLASQRAWAEDYLTALRSRRALRVVDVVPVNPYPTVKEGPEAAARLVRGFRGTLRRLGIDKPVWVGEINYGVAGGGDPTTHRIPARRQAAYVARTFLLMADAGVRRVHWFRWTHFDDVGVQLSRPDGTATRAARAWRRVHAWVAGSRFAGCSVARDRVRVCVARRDGLVHRVYWRPTGTSTVRTPASTRQWQRLAGRPVTHRGSVTLSVGTAPVRVVSRR